MAGNRAVGAGEPPAASATPHGVSVEVPRADTATSSVSAPAPASMTVRTLGGDVGDHRRPRNLKLAVDLPASVRRFVPQLRGRHFRVHVFPADWDDARGAVDAHRADGVRVWASGERLYLDVRALPPLAAPGDYAVRVGLAPGGRELLSSRASTPVRATAGADVDVALVIDVSRSMVWNDPRDRRLDAARSFVSLAAEHGRVATVGVATFHLKARTVAPLTPLAEQAQVLAALRKVSNRGGTNLDAALREGMRILEAGTSPRRAIVLLTDGKNDGAVYADAHRDAAARGIPIYAIGLSDEADHATLAAMARETEGEYFPAAHDGELLDVYQRIAMRLGHRTVVARASSSDGANAFAWPVDETAARMQVTLDGRAELAVFDPDGRAVDESRTGVRWLPDPSSRVLDVARPAPGGWRAAWTRSSEGSGGQGVVTVESDLFVDLFPPEMEGRMLRLGATLAHGRDVPVDATVEVDVQGARRAVVLYDDGRHGDGDAGDGVFAGEVALDDRVAGAASIAVRARGRTGGGYAFRRETAGRLRGIPSMPPPSARAPEPTSGESESTPEPEPLPPPSLAAEAPTLAPTRPGGRATGGGFLTYVDAAWEEGSAPVLHAGCRTPWTPSMANDALSQGTVSKGTAARAPPTDGAAEDASSTTRAWTATAWRVERVPMESDAAPGAASRRPDVSAVDTAPPVSADASRLTVPAPSVPGETVSPGRHAWRIRVDVPPDVLTGHYENTVRLTVGDAWVDVPLRLEVACDRVAADRRSVAFAPLRPGGEGTARVGWRGRVVEDGTAFSVTATGTGADWLRMPLASSTLPSGEFAQTTELRATVPARALPGDYAFTLTARAGEARASVSGRIRVVAGQETAVVAALPMSPSSAPSAPAATSLAIDLAPRGNTDGGAAPTLPDAPVANAVPWSAPPTDSAATSWTLAPHPPTPRGDAPVERVAAPEAPLGASVADASPLPTVALDGESPNAPASDATTSIQEAASASPARSALDTARVWAQWLPTLLGVAALLLLLTALTLWVGRAWWRRGWQRPMVRATAVALAGNVFLLLLFTAWMGASGQLAPMERLTPVLVHLIDMKENFGLALSDAETAWRESAVSSRAVAVPASATAGEVFAESVAPAAAEKTDDAPASRRPAVDAVLAMADAASAEATPLPMRPMDVSRADVSVAPVPDPARRPALRAERPRWTDDASLPSPVAPDVLADAADAAPLSPPVTASVTKVSADTWTESAMARRDEDHITEKTRRPTPPPPALVAASTAPLPADPHATEAIMTRPASWETKGVDGSVVERTTTLTRRRADRPTRSPATARWTDDTAFAPTLAMSEDPGANREDASERTATTGRTRPIAEVAFADGAAVGVFQASSFPPVSDEKESALDEAPSRPRRPFTEVVAEGMFAPTMDSPEAAGPALARLGKVAPASAHPRSGPSKGIARSNAFASPPRTRGVNELASASPTMDAPSLPTPLREQAQARHPIEGDALRRPATDGVAEARPTLLASAGNVPPSAYGLRDASSPDNAAHTWSTRPALRRVDTASLSPFASTPATTWSADRPPVIAGPERMSRGNREHVAEAAPLRARPSDPRVPRRKDNLAAELMAEAPSAWTTRSNASDTATASNDRVSGSAATSRTPVRAEVAFAEAEVDAAFSHSRAVDRRPAASDEHTVARALSVPDVSMGSVLAASDGVHPSVERTTHATSAFPLLTRRSDVPPRRMEPAGADARTKTFDPSDRSVEAAIPHALASTTTPAVPSRAVPRRVSPGVDAVPAADGEAMATASLTRSPADDSSRRSNTSRVLARGMADAPTAETTGTATSFDGTSVALASMRLAASSAGRGPDAGATAPLRRPRPTDVAGRGDVHADADRSALTHGASTLPARTESTDGFAAAFPGPRPGTGGAGVSSAAGDADRWDGVSLASRGTPDVTRRAAASAPAWREDEAAPLRSERMEREVLTRPAAVAFDPLLTRPAAMPTVDSRPLATSETSGITVRRRVVALDATPAPPHAAFAAEHLERFCREKLADRLPLDWRVESTVPAHRRADLLFVDGANARHPTASTAAACVDWVAGGGSLWVDGDGDAREFAAGIASRAGWRWAALPSEHPLTPRLARYGGPAAWGAFDADGRLRVAATSWHWREAWRGSEGDANGERVRSMARAVTLLDGMLGTAELTDGVASHTADARRR